ncbi:MAG: DNA translocase FtsK 4TM domain-containing protein, partial [Candidatus Omnitrophica bacterium]|nr:DNA translocase FtsK 4TM domain-containing protein [Candidatus Omnitrophota bacterium]
YVAPIIVLIWGISRLIQVEESKVYFKFIGAIVLVSAVSASLSIISDVSAVMSFTAGGLVGSIVSDFLLRYLGRIGAVVFISAIIILSVLVATEFLILPIVAGLFRFFSTGFGKIKEFISENVGRYEEDEKTYRRPGKLAEAKKEIAKKLENVKKQVEEARSTAFARKASSDVKMSSPKGPKIVTSKNTEKVARKVSRKTETENKKTGEILEYELPSLDLLNKPSKNDQKEKGEILKQRATLLETTLLEFGVEASVVKINRGPVITMYELEPSMGTKVNRITSLGDNISLAMKSANIRIVAPLPGKGTIGIEVPNSKSEKVLLRDIVESVEYNEEESPIKIALGKNISGEAMVTDLAKMPHMLIAGATGSGKTVCINCIISSILLNSSPDEVKFLMIDPKRVELMMFEGIPHLVAPIVTNPKKAAVALNWVVGEMERRYEVFAKNGVRNIGVYKEKKTEKDENLPYIVVVVDELADLMMVGQQDVEMAIMRIAQLSRAAGIHMILATQRPSVNVITGVIKANFPARISFKVASKVDSRTVLDSNGAEKLLGRGDMLLMEPGEASLIRGQCSLVEDSEIKKLVKFIKIQSGPQYIVEISDKQDKRSGESGDEKDDLYDEAIEMVLTTQQASVSMIQRKLRIGYNRAARIIDVMEEDGIVGSYNGSKPREILMENMDDIEVVEEEEGDKE